MVNLGREGGKLGRLETTGGGGVVNCRNLSEWSDGRDFLDH